MANRLTFNSVVLKSFAREAKGGTAQFTASYSEAVCAAMHWPEWDDALRGTDPDGEISASGFELTPAKKELRDFRVGFGVVQIYKFEVVRRELKGKQGKGFRPELRFKVDFQDTDGCAALERYMLTIGETAGKIEISYTRQPDQQELPMATDEQRAAMGEIEVQ